MKKVIIIHHFGGLGGAGKSLINNVKIMKEMCDLTVITPNYPDDIFKKLNEIDGISVKAFNSIPSVPIYSGGYNLMSPRLYFHLIKSSLNLKSFIKILKKQNPDIIIVNSIIMSWVSIFLKGVKKVCFVRETKSKSIFNSVQKILLKKFNLVCFISQYDANSWAIDTNVVINENSVDERITESYEETNNNKNNKLNILFLGGTSFIKGFYHLCFAMYKVKNRKKINIIVLGECRTFGINFSRILFGKIFPFTFIGKVSNVSYYYNIVDLVIFPVIKVHQGRPIFEAGMHKRPVLIPDFPNFREFVVHMENGIIYKKKSSKALSEELSKVCDGYYNLKSLGEINYNKFVKKHTYEAAKERVREIIKAIFVL